MLELRVAEGCRPTGRILSQLLRRQGVNLVEHGHRADGIVSYGVRVRDANIPVLNGNAGRYDKLAQLEHLKQAKVACLQALRNVPADQAAYPLIARQLHHVAGRDIRVCLQPEDAEFARRRGADFFTTFIPRRTEYRVWVYRRQHLGTYEKYLAHPEKYRKFGCNYHNGWAFRLINEANIPRDVVELAGRAVDALGLDFGAADILVPKVGTPVVLEVNTAPGVEGDGRQVIQALARKIARWVAIGYKRRNGADRD